MLGALSDECRRHCGGMNEEKTMAMLDNASTHKVSANDGQNICGLLVHAHPSRTAAVGEAMTALPGTEIHQSSPDGRMVVTVEDVDGVWAGDTITQINNIDGVLSAALVYHQNEVVSHEAGDPEEVSR